MSLPQPASRAIAVYRSSLSATKRPSPPVTGLSLSSLAEQNRAVRQRLTRFRRRDRRLVGIIVTHLFGRGEVDRVVLRERFLITPGEGHLVLREVRQLRGLGARRCTGQ